MGYFRRENVDKMELRNHQKKAGENTKDIKAPPSNVLK